MKFVEWVFSQNKGVNQIFSIRGLFFTTEFLPKTPVFKLKNRFVFYQTWAVDIQTTLEFLQFIPDFLTLLNKVR